MNNKSVMEYVVLIGVVPIFLAFTIMLLSSVFYTTGTGKVFDYSFLKSFLIFLGLTAVSIGIHLAVSRFVDIYKRLHIFSKVLFPLFCGAFGMYVSVKIKLRALATATPAEVKSNMDFTSTLIFGALLLVPILLVCLTIDWGGREIWKQAGETE